LTSPRWQYILNTEKRLFKHNYPTKAVFRRSWQITLFKTKTV
jgi:hypothetical protein